jgi:hypothetical protein
MKILPRAFEMTAALALVTALAGGCSSLPHARSGLYVNQEHRFSVDYPPSYKTEPLRQDEVFRAANPSPYKLPVVTAAVADLRPGATLDPASFMQVMQRRIPGTTGFQVMSQQDVVLNDSTPAKAFVFEWTWSDGKTKMMTAALIAIKDGKYYNATATGTPSGGPTAQQLLEIVKSWEFH